MSSIGIEDTDAKLKINSELYNALMIKKDEQKVIELCRKVPDHALYVFTIHDDTVLLMATYTKKSDLVIKLLDELPDQLVRKIDYNGNTILHMAGIKRKDYVSEKMEGPALLLGDELLWYERVKSVTMAHSLNHGNNMGFTPEELFAIANNELRAQSKEWLIRTTEGCPVVAFAAAYTVPGGSDENIGYPILINHLFFVAFTVSDVLSLTFSLAAVVPFLSMLTSPFRLEDCKHSLPNKMILGFTFLLLSVCLMMVAFIATILLMIKSEESWAKIMLYTCTFIPVGVFALSYFPLYITKSVTRGLNYLRDKTKIFVPQWLVNIFCFLSNSFKVKATSSSIS
ncbi:ankyrin repeat-containing protein ITN1 [Citrus clementina]|uniref:ankyrin repeat-containing protein ITN1 n=1 Tax=Citrus clementina TaxID=85681 RepID=UPI000CED25A0|nr:ankyrin repeat-containing protein ITN1 [Citrus x clementina]